MEAEISQVFDTDFPIQFRFQYISLTIKLKLFQTDSNESIKLFLNININNKLIRIICLRNLVTLIYVILYVSESWKRTNSEESLVCESDYVGHAIFIFYILYFII